MGTWGTGILQNDTTVDIWREFKDLYNKGLSAREIRLQLESEYDPQSSTEYYTEIWTGIAYGQWMCGDVEDYTFKKLKDATNIKWLTRWAGNKKLLGRRIIAISNFFEKIKIPRPNPLKRKRVVVRQAFFKTGDVIGIQLNPEYSIAAIVTDHKDFENDGQNTIAFTDFIFKSQPTLKQVLNSNILYLDIGGSNKYYRGFFKAIFSARNMVKQINKAFIIGKIDTTEFLWLGIGIPIGNWNKIGNLVGEQLSFLKDNESDRPLNVPLSKFLQRDKKMETALIEWDKKIFREKLKPPNT